MAVNSVVLYTYVLGMQVVHWVVSNLYGTLIVLIYSYYCVVIDPTLLCRIEEMPDPNCLFSCLREGYILSFN